MNTWQYLRPGRARFHLEPLEQSRETARGVRHVIRMEIKLRVVADRDDDVNVSLVLLPNLEYLARGSRGGAALRNCSDGVDVCCHPGA